jgi:tRNA(fMet)-specific endonuclease VapC
VKYLLDTNICVFLIRRQPPALIQRLTSHAPEGIGVSTITVAELQSGVMKSQDPPRNQAALDLFLLPLDILPFDHPASVAYGQVRADLERRGLPIGALDTLIAAHALSLGAVAVTNNVREFARVTGLAVEDWTTD